MLFAADPGARFLFHTALMYWACAQAKALNFSKLFKALERFLPSAEKRWRLVLRVKRGLADQGKAGGFGKDQAYFEGAVAILRHASVWGGLLSTGDEEGSVLHNAALAKARSFFVGLYAGKVTMRDVAGGAVERALRRAASDDDSAAEEDLLPHFVFESDDTVEGVTDLPAQSKSDFARSCQRLEARGAGPADADDDADDADDADAETEEPDDGGGGFQHSSFERYIRSLNEIAELNGVLILDDLDEGKGRPDAAAGAPPLPPREEAGEEGNGGGGQGGVGSESDVEDEADGCIETLAMLEGDDSDDESAGGDGDGSSNPAANPDLTRVDRDGGRRDPSAAVIPVEPAKKKRGGGCTLS